MLTISCKTDTSNQKQPILLPIKSAPQTTQEPATSTMYVSTSEVKYAQPGAVHWPPQEVLPPSVSTQYQGLRASRVDTIAVYNVPQL